MNRNIFIIWFVPTSHKVEKYILDLYKTNKKDVEINYALKEKIKNIAKKIIKLTEKYGNKTVFCDILKMKDILLKEIEKENFIF